MGLGRPRFALHWLHQAVDRLGYGRMASTLHI